MLFAQTCSTLCNPMDYSPLGSSVHGILQARILEWIIIPFSRGSSQPRDWTQVSCTAGRFFTVWATREDCLMSFISSNIQFIWISLVVSNMSFQASLNQDPKVFILLSLIVMSSKSLTLTVSLPPFIPPCNWFLGKRESFAPISPCGAV